MLGQAVRPAARAGLFYPRQAAQCRELVDQCLGSSEVPERPPGFEPVAAIVPHAGWVYSGRIAAGALRSLAARSAPVRTVVLFGAVHVPGVGAATVSPAKAWETPLGLVPVDQEAARRVGTLLGSGEAAHRGEHSLEVQVPFLQVLFPEAEILPIAVPPDEDAASVGAAVAEALADLGDGVVYVGSTDMTHYGPRFGFSDHGLGAQGLRWVKQDNDARMLRLMETMKEHEVVAEAQASWNACGAGAIAATLAAARARGATRGHRTGYTTSADVMGESRPDDFVGYAGFAY